jgi:hypothetical protein
MQMHRNDAFPKTFSIYTCNIEQLCIYKKGPGKCIIFMHLHY